MIFCVYSLTGALTGPPGGIAEQKSNTNINFTSISRTLIIPERKQKVRRPMAFASGSTGPCSRAAGAEEFYAIAFRKKIYENLVALQDDIDKWIHYYNSERTHSGRSTFGFLNILSDRYEMFGHTSPLKRQ